MITLWKNPEINVHHLGNITYHEIIIEYHIINIYVQVYIFRLSGGRETISRRDGGGTMSGRCGHHRIYVWPLGSTSNDSLLLGVLV
jgi:hypothetical protein